MSKIQSVGYPYTSTLQKNNKSSSYQNYQKHSINMLSTRNDVSFTGIFIDILGGISTSLDNYVKNARTQKQVIKARNLLADAARERMADVKNWMKSIIAGQTTKIEIDGKEAVFNIKNSQKKALNEAVDYCTNPWDAGNIKEFGIQEFLGVTKSSPELDPLVKEFFTRLKNTGCEHTYQGKNLIENYELAEKIFARRVARSSKTVD